MDKDCCDGRYCVLVVDDEPINSMLMKRYLKEMEIDSVVASSSSEVLLEIEKCSFDLVLMDYKLPDKTGIEVTEEIKKRYPQARVCIQTALESEEIQECVDSGFFVGYISKPFRRERFFREVKALLPTN